MELLHDVKKRKIMGSIADKYCDNIILTDDDPRDEDPSHIAEEIRSGIESTNTVYIPQRKDAIRQAIEMANPHDTVLILGKVMKNISLMEMVRNLTSEITMPLKWQLKSIT